MHLTVPRRPSCTPRLRRTRWPWCKWRARATTSKRCVSGSGIGAYPDPELVRIRIRNWCVSGSGIGCVPGSGIAPFFSSSGFGIRQTGSDQIFQTPFCPWGKYSTIKEQAALQSIAIFHLFVLFGHCCPPGSGSTFRILIQPIKRSPCH
jgi:hypothetical protein